MDHQIFTGRCRAASLDAAARQRLDRACRHGRGPAPRTIRVGSTQYRLASSLTVLSPLRATWAWNAAVCCFRLHATVPPFPGHQSSLAGGPGFGLPYNAHSCEVFYLPRMHLHPLYLCFPHAFCISVSDVRRRISYHSIIVPITEFVTRQRGAAIVVDSAIAAYTSESFGFDSPSRTS